MAYDFEISVNNAQVVHVVKAARDSRNLASEDPERSRVNEEQMRSQLEWKAYQFRFLRIGSVLEVYTQVELFHEVENQGERVFSCAVCSNEGDYVPMG